MLGRSRFRERGSRTSRVAPEKKKLDANVVWREARAIIWERRGRLGIGLVLMLVGRLAGLVLPATSKYLIDDVIGKGRAELLGPLALAAGVATLVQAVTSFALSQLLGVAAQRAITDMRKRVQAHVLRLPTSLLRLGQERRADLAHHDRRRGHSEPRRHGPRSARRRPRHRFGRARRCSSISTGG